MPHLTTLVIWVVVIGVVFAFLWWKGYLLRFSGYVQQTREELKKCTWPSWDELKGSTVLISILIIAMGVFTFVVDYVLGSVIHLLRL